MSKWNEKRAKAELLKIDKELDSGYGSVDYEAMAAADTRAAACGAGEEELFERKLTKEEKKAAAKAAREAKKAAKVCSILYTRSYENGSSACSRHWLILTLLNSLGDTREAGGNRNSK